MDDGFRECRYCDEEFFPERHWQIFCSPKCRKHYYNEARMLAGHWKDLVKALRVKGHNEAAEIVTNWLKPGF